LVKKHRGRGPSPSAPLETIADRAAEALREERFKTAIEQFKLLLRMESRPEWQAALAEAYGGRARELAAKGMFKEAAIVLENTVAADGMVRDPAFYASCLVRDSQQQKAAAHLLAWIGRRGSLPPDQQVALEELTAALLVAVPTLPGLAASASAEVSRWHQLAMAARAALAAWVDGAPGEVLEKHLNAISLRSPFKPVRLLLKCLITQPPDAARREQLLNAIPPSSPFFSFRHAVEAALLPHEEGWSRLTPAQQVFVTETNGLPAAAAELLKLTSGTPDGGAAKLFSHLLRQPDLVDADQRSACLNLVPHIPDGLAHFEKHFGRLPALERARMRALTAEARGDWETVETSWQAVVASLDDTGPDAADQRQAKLAKGVIFRHLAHLAARYPDITGGDEFGDAVLFYLERSCKVDGEYVPGLLELMDYYHKEAMDKEWHRLVDDTAQRFPEDNQVLERAINAAMARKAYKKAAGFARQALRINPINPGVRRRMIELQIAHARKQMRGKRPDLATRELEDAAEWERADAPSATLRIARAVVASGTGATQQAEQWLREGVDLAGGGVAGWFRAQLEAELMKSSSQTKRLRTEQARAREIPPTREAVMAIIATLGQPEAVDAKRVVAGLLHSLRAWLLQAREIDWSAAEFQTLADTLVRYDAFDLLAEFARAGRMRDAGNAIWRFHEAVARTRGNAFLLTMSEGDDLTELAHAAGRGGDIHLVNRIQRFLDGPQPAEVRHRRRSTGPDMDFDDPAALAGMLDAMMGGMPRQATESVRELVGQVGREGAVSALMENFRAGPSDLPMPDAALRELCQAIVARALQGRGPAPHRTAPELPFR
jgi:tetratricopeptide (TPR) repeat protein